MSNAIIEEGLHGFLAAPGPESAFALIMKCQSYLCNIAGSWREANLSRIDKIRELASEMLLVLLEDFDRTRVVHPRSILAFVHQRLKRLTRPHRSRETAFGLTDSMPEVGRVNFTPVRREFAEEIFQTVRGFLKGYPDENASQLAFLFVHVFPEVPWASRMLAEREGSEFSRRLEADKKRLATFNQSLRAQFKHLSCGDWREVTEWSSGERSHLAWRIISISPAEVEAAVEPDLIILDGWRERIDRRQPQSQNDLASALRVYGSIKGQESVQPQTLQIAAEEAAPWGESSDLLLQLIGGVRETSIVEEEAGEWQGIELMAGKVVNIDDPDFKKIAEELSQWIGELHGEKAKSSQQMGQKVLKYS